MTVKEMVENMNGLIKMRGPEAASKYLTEHIKETTLATEEAIMVITNNGSDRVGVYRESIRWEYKPAKVYVVSASKDIYDAIAEFHNCHGNIKEVKIMLGNKDTIGNYVSTCNEALDELNEIVEQQREAIDIFEYHNMSAGVPYIDRLIVYDEKKETFGYSDIFQRQAKMIMDRMEFEEALKGNMKKTPKGNSPETLKGNPPKTAEGNPPKAAKGEINNKVKHKLITPIVKPKFRPKLAPKSKPITIEPKKITISELKGESNTKITNAGKNKMSLLTPQIRAENQNRTAKK